MSLIKRALRMTLFIQFALCPLLAMGKPTDATAALGPSGSGGGDRCEERFKAITKDLKNWLAAGGAQYLDFRSTPVTQETYEARMMGQIERAPRITCVGPGDEGYPVLVNGRPKECRSFSDEAGFPRIICDRNKFYLNTPDPENDPVQYRIVHHEFATLARLEIPNEDDSDYTFSNQITGFLENQVVKRLAVKPVHSQPSKNARKERIGTGAYTSAKNELETYRYILNLAGRSMSKIKITSVNGYGHVMGIQFETTGSRSMNCALDSEEISIGIFGNLKEEMDEFLSLRQMDPGALVDAEMTGTLATGAIQSIRLTYCQ